jgi:hypothetical protein
VRTRVQHRARGRCAEAGRAGHGLGRSTEPDQAVANIGIVEDAAAAKPWPARGEALLKARSPAPHPQPERARPPPLLRPALRPDAPAQLPRVTPRAPEPRVPVVRRCQCRVLWGVGPARLPAAGFLPGFRGGGGGAACCLLASGAAQRFPAEACRASPTGPAPCAQHECVPPPRRRARMCLPLPPACTPLEPRLPGALEHVVSGVMPAASTASTAGRSSPSHAVPAVRGSARSCRRGDSSCARWLIISAHNGVVIRCSRSPLF